MDLAKLLRICKAYNDLGWSIQEQLHDLIEGDPEGLNANAVREIDRSFLAVVARTDLDWDLVREEAGDLRQGIATGE